MKKLPEIVGRGLCPITRKLYVEIKNEKNIWKDEEKWLKIKKFNKNIIKNDGARSEQKNVPVFAPHPWVLTLFI